MRQGLYVLYQEMRQNLYCSTSNKCERSISGLAQVGEFSLVRAVRLFKLQQVHTQRHCNVCTYNNLNRCTALTKLNLCRFATATLQSGRGQRQKACLLVLVQQKKNRKKQEKEINKEIRYLSSWRPSTSALSLRHVCTYYNLNRCTALTKLNLCRFAMSHCSNLSA